MTPADLPLPAAVVGRLRALLDAVPGAELRAHREDLPGGFTKPEAIRAHLAGLLDRPDRCPPWLPELLRAQLRCAGVVLGTAGAALPVLGHVLPPAVGDADWAAALVLDGRPEARALLREALAWPYFGRDPTEEGRTRYAEFVAGTFLTEVLPDWRPPQPAAAAAPVEADGMRQEWERLRAENAELQAAVQHPNEHQRRRLRDQEERLRAEFAAARGPLDEQIAALSAKVAGLASARDEARGRLADAEAEAKRLAAELAESRSTVDAEVERRLAGEQLAWLRAARGTERAADLAGACTDELLAGVDRLLVQQAEQDRHAGNRRRLREDLARLETAVARLEAAQTDALLPLPQLATTRDVLLARLAETRRALGLPAAPPSPAVRGLRSAMSRANAAEDFDRLADLLRELRKLGLLSDAEATALDAELEPRRAAFLARGGLRESVRTRLQQRLRERRPLLLLLDGYNVTRLLPGLVPDGALLPEARRRLNDAVKALVGRHPGLTTTVVYDSPEARRDEVTPRLVIEFSGGGHGPDRADNRIRELLDEALARPDAPPAFVVSDDFAVRRDADRWAARFLSVTDLGVVLQDEGLLP